MSHEIETSKEFCLVLCAGPNENCSIDWDGNTGYPTLEDGLVATRELVDESGGDYMLYRCIPVKRIVRGSTRVLSVKPAK